MKNITHAGEVKEIDGNIVQVQMCVNSACVSCGAKSACGAAESVDKSVFVFVEEPEYFKVGESVVVEITKMMGLKAVAFAYLLPFFLLLSTLLISLELKCSEVVAGVLSLCVTALYYVGLYVMKDRVEGEITFNIKKI